MKFLPSNKANSCIWLRKAPNSKCYEYIALYVDKPPLDKNDHPELDTSEILEGDMAAKYLTMVGQVQWLVTLGRFDIHAQVATMSRFRPAPRQGHMDRLKRIYSYVIRTKD